MREDETQRRQLIEIELVNDRLEVVPVGTRPCSQITAHLGDSPVWRSTHGSNRSSAWLTSEVMELILVRRNGHHSSRLPAGHRGLGRQAGGLANEAGKAGKAGRTARRAEDQPRMCATSARVIAAVPSFATELDRPDAGHRLVQRRARECGHRAPGAARHADRRASRASGPPRGPGRPDWRGPCRHNRALPWAG